MTLVGSFVLLKLISFNDIMWPFFFLKWAKIVNIALVKI